MAYAGLIRKRSKLSSNSSLASLVLKEDEYVTDRDQQEDNGSLDRKLEILNFSKELSGYNLSFSVLTSKKPKKFDERAQLLEIAKFISGHSHTRGILLNDKTIPSEYIVNTLGTPKRFLKKNKLYLIAISLLLCGPYSRMREYFLEEES